MLHIKRWKTMEKIYTEVERLELLISALEGDNQLKFATRCGIPASTISRVKMGIIKLRSQVDKIVTAYPQVSRDWLMTGIGYPGDISLDIAKRYYEKALEERNETIHILSKELEIQQQLIEELNKIIKKQ